jgi:hypothetical protein
MQENNRSRQVILLLIIFFCACALHVTAQPPALPETVINAHTVFLVNDTGFPEMQYTAVLELTKWGHFGLAESREKADLVLSLSTGTHVRALPDGQYPRPTGLNAFAEDEVPKDHTRVALLDPKTGATLWSDLRKTEGGRVKNGHLLDGLREAFDSYEKGKNRK